ncbi:hypothetical protein ACWGJ6_23185 [Streptomyces canus]
MGVRYRDPECECEVEYPGARRLWCEHCRTDGPLPGSLADPKWEQRHNDPAVLREAAERLGDGDPLAERLLTAARQLAGDPA